MTEEVGRHIDAARRPPSDAAIDYLVAHGSAATRAAASGFTAEKGEPALSRIAAATAAYDLCHALSWAELTAVVDPTTVAQRVRDGGLLSWTVGPGDVRFPAWQVHGDRWLPHLTEVADAVPTGAHPREVSEVMTAIDPDLEGMTRAAWLAAGGHPAPVLATVAAIGRG